MKSKTSFFNGTIFKKNFTLFWPIWLGYLGLIIILLDGILFFGFKQNAMCLDGADKLETTERYLRTVLSAVNMSSYIIVDFIAALLIGMALFNYLYSSKSANMLHSLPITRNEHFGTNVISGLVMLCVPQIIAFVIAVMLCLVNGVTCINVLGEWLLSGLAVSFIAYSMVTFCAFLTGQLFALPLYFFALNFLYVFIRLLASFLCSIIAYGFDGVALLNSDKFYWLAPMNYLLENVSFYSKNTFTRETDYVTGISFTGMKVLGTYVLAAIVFYMIAFIFYKRRNLENAGDAITVGFVKPIFKWGVGATFGYGGAMIIYSVLSEIDVQIGRIGLVILSVLVGAICYFFAQMYLEKNFRVINRKSIKGCGYFSIFIVVIFCSLNILVTKKEKFVPQIDDIDKAYISNNYAIEYDGDEIKEVLKLHNCIIDNISKFRKAGNNYDYNYSVKIIYQLKNGQIVKRDYMLPHTAESDEIFEVLNKEETKAENFVSYIYGWNYEGSTEVDEARIELYDDKVEHVASVSFDEDDAQLLNQAIMEDIKAGNIQKYNISDGSVNKSYTSDLYISLKVKNSSDYVSPDDIRWGNFDFYLINNSKDYYQSYGIEYYENSISFGPECENTINALIDLGAIESKDDLKLYPDEW